MRSETKRKLLAICSVGIGVCVIIVAGLLGQKYVDFKEYAVFTYDGVNGYAGVKCSIDTEKLYNDLALNEGNADKAELYKKFVASVKVMTTQMDLSNGDKVYAKVDYDKEIAMQVGIRVANDSVESRATGIQEGKKIDLFDGIEVIFTGISPEAKVVVNNKHENSYVAGLEYRADKTEGIVVGDEIKITCQVTEAELGRHGYVAEELSHVYKADHLSTYVENYAQITDKVKLSLQQEIEAGIKSLVEDTTFRMMYKATGDAKYLRMANDESVSNIQFEEAKFLKRKSGELQGMDNYIVYLYSGDVTIGDGSEDSVTEKVYFAIEYQQGYVTYQGEFQIECGDISKRYSCSTDYSTIMSSTLVGGKPGYNIEDLAKCTYEPQ